MACPSQCAFCRNHANTVFGCRPQDERPVCISCMDRICSRCWKTNVELVGPDSVCPQCDFTLRLYESITSAQHLLLNQIKQLRS